MDVNHQDKAREGQNFLIDRERLIKLLGLLGSDHNGEIASAGRMADALIRDAGVTWADVIGPDAAQRKVVDALRAENTELQEQVRRLLVQNDELQVRARASRAMFYKRRDRAKRLAVLIIALVIAFSGFWLVFGLFD
jgi:hypothetical protein